MSTRLHIVVSEGLLASVDQARGDVPRSVWLRRVVERELARLFDGVLDGILEPSSGSVEGAVERALSEPWDPEVRQSRPAVPAEQPKSMFRGPEAEAETLALLLGGPAPRRHLSGCKCPVCK